MVQPPQPDDFIVDATGNGTHSTLTDALRDLPPTSRRVLVRPGIYEESVIVERDLQIFGIGPREQIRIQSREGNCLRVQNGSVEARGLTLQGAAASTGKRFHAVSASGGALMLEECDIFSDTLAGVAVRGAQASVSLRNCKLRGANEAVLCENGTLHLRNCRLEGGTRASLRVTGGEASLFNCNLEKSKGSGVLLHAGRAILEACRLLKHARAGAQADGGELVLRRCTVLGNGQHGVSIRDEGTGVVESCTIADNTLGAWDISDERCVTRTKNRC